MCSYIGEIMNKAIKGYYDGEEITITEGYIDALKNLMLEELMMMQKAHPDFADCWSWGKCTVGDLAGMKRLDFEYGGEEDKPEDMDSVVQVFITGGKDNGRRVKIMS